MDAIISREFINLKIPAGAKEEILSNMADVLIQNGRINDKQAYLKTVLEREKMTSTAIGFGVGIPHGKSDAVKSATVFFGRCQEGIIWDDEGEIVKLIFLLAVPSVAASNQHLKILAALSRKLMDESFIALLMKGENQEEILASLNEALALAKE